MIADAQCRDGILTRGLALSRACNSGQALEAKEKRRGPMNTRGLAQLAYEKGMYVLTAAQGVSLFAHGMRQDTGLQGYLAPGGINDPVDIEAVIPDYRNPGIWDSLQDAGQFQCVEG